MACAVVHTHRLALGIKLSVSVTLSKGCQMMRMKLFRVAIVPVTVLCVWFLTVPTVVAQARFQIESRDVLPDSSLVIYTIRDSQLATCYTLFVVEAPPTPAPTLTATQPASNGVEEARTARNEQLAALRIRVAARSPFDRVAYARDDEVARRKIEDAFDAAIRGVPMMTTLPFDSPIPGLQTGGYQYQAEEMRRATVDPTTDRAAADYNHRLESWLMQAAQAPRIAASGPVPCKPSAPKNIKP
jgi:hypothetical protein